jgi:hypothetical protein
MKKLLLSAAISAAFIAPAYSQDLHFDADSFSEEVNECLTTTDDYCLNAEFGDAGYFTVWDALTSQALVDDANDLQVLAETEAASAEAALAALDETATAEETAAAEALKTSTAAAALEAAATTASLVSVQLESQAFADSFTGVMAEAGKSIAEKDWALVEASMAYDEASEAAILAASDAEVAISLIDDASDLRAAALINYVDATAALAADPTSEELQDNKLAAAAELQSSSTNLATAEAAGESIIAASAAATSAAEAANDVYEAANEAFEAAIAVFNEENGDWENHFETNVVAAQWDADYAAAKLASAETSAETASAELAAAETSATAAGVALTAAQDAVTEAEASVDAAQATFDALPGTATVAEITAATTALEEAQTAAAAAVIAEATSSSAAATADAAVTLAEAGVTVAAADVAERELFVDETSENLAEAKAETAVHEDYLGNDSNPANALISNIFTSEDNAQAVVTAVSDTYGFTVDNATGIEANVATLAVHEGLVTQNIADIATNATGIATNATGIAANVATLAVHEGLVTQNIADIATNATGIEANVATLAVHEGLVMQNIDNIGMNTSSINTLSADVDVLRSGVAASLAHAGMPVAPGAGWGFAVGTGHFDGESAVAAGLTFRSKTSSYKLSFGSSGGETSGSAGAAWNF